MLIRAPAAGGVTSRVPGWLSQYRTSGLNCPSPAFKPFDSSAGGNFRGILRYRCRIAALPIGKFATSLATPIRRRYRKCVSR